MKKRDTIIHKGIIKEIKNNHLKVEIIQVSACAMCESRSHCNVSDMSQKIIDIYTDSSPYSEGQEVNVHLAKDLALKALFFAYMLPFILVVLVLVIVWGLTHNELTSGIASIGILIPYFLGLKFFEKNFRKIYTFSILN